MSSQIEDAFNEALERRASGYEQRIAALDDLVQRAWSLIAGAMSGNPHKPIANSEWMDAAHRWEIDYCMGQGSSVPEHPCRAEDDARHPQDEFDGAGCCPEEDGFLRAKARAAATPDPPEGCRAPHCWSEYGTPCGTCPAATPDPVAAPDDGGWSPGIDDPEPLALGDIDTGEGWYQT